MSELNSEIRFNILVPLVVDMIQKREREKGSLVKESSHVEYNAAVDAIVDAVIQALPKSYAEHVKQDVASLWGSADATDGYNQALEDTRKLLLAAKSGGTQ